MPKLVRRNHASAALKGLFDGAGTETVLTKDYIVNSPFRIRYMASVLDGIADAFVYFGKNRWTVSEQQTSVAGVGDDITNAITIRDAATDKLYLQLEAKFPTDYPAHLVFSDANGSQHERLVIHGRHIEIPQGTLEFPRRAAAFLTQWVADKITPGEPGVRVEAKGHHPT